MVIAKEQRKAWHIGREISLSNILTIVGLIFAALQFYGDLKEELSVAKTERTRQEYDSRKRDEEVTRLRESVDALMKERRK